MSMRSARDVRLNRPAVAAGRRSRRDVRPGCARLSPRFTASKSSTKLDRLLDVGPVHAFEGRVLEQQRQSARGRGGQEPRALPAATPPKGSARRNPAARRARPRRLRAPRARARSAPAPEPQNALGVDRVRIAPQGLDPGDAERARAQFDRRARRRPLRPARPPPAGRARGRSRDRLAAPLGRLDRLCAGRRLDPQEKARGDGRLAAALLRAAEDRLAGAERGDKVMRRLPDAPLGRREPELGAHRSVEKGVGLDRGRPDLFVEPGQQRAVEARAGALRAGRESSGADGRRGPAARARRRARRRTARHIRRACRRIPRPPPRSTRR